ncbi:ALF repeat-containing protein, partial [Streptomyces kronopolitis]
MNNGSLSHGSASPPTRGACALSLAVSLVAGLLGASPAAAATDQNDLQVMREAAVDSWVDGGAGVKEAAERALLGTDEDLEIFLDQRDRIEFDDDYVDASRIFNAGGPAVREAARTALKNSTSDNPEALRTFLKDGWKAPQEEDREVEVSRVINFGGNGVRDAGKAALKGTPEDRAKFLAEGQYAARETDNEVEVSQLVNSGGPAVKAAGKVALKGTADDIAEFLEVGQFVARDRDQEHATIAQLTEQATLAGKRAKDAT